MDEPKCESCGTPWADHPGMMAICAELQRLRKLCADRPDPMIWKWRENAQHFAQWVDSIDAAGRGEGKGQ